MSDDSNVSCELPVRATLQKRWVGRLALLLGGVLYGLALVCMVGGAGQGVRLGLWITPLTLAILMGIAKSGSA